jgi:hypothetical protein
MKFQAIRNGLLKCAIIINDKKKPVVFKGFYPKNRENEAAASRICIR